MLESVFKNQVFMTFLIMFIWMVPGILITSASRRNSKYRQKERQLKKISKLYPQ